MNAAPIFVRDELQLDPSGWVDTRPLRGISGKRDIAYVYEVEMIIATLDPISGDESEPLVRPVKFAFGNVPHLVFGNEDGLDDLFESYEVVKNPRRLIVTTT